MGAGGKWNSAIGTLVRPYIRWDVLDVGAKSINDIPRGSFVEEPIRRHSN